MISSFMEDPLVDFIDKWLHEDYEKYLKRQNLSTKIILFEREKELELKKKYPNLPDSDLLERVSASSFRKFKKEIRSL